jgi:hypothetical protein
VSNRAVEKRRRELVLGNAAPPQPGEHLTHAEQIEMIDQKGAQQGNRPPNKTGDRQRRPPGLGGDPPNVVSDRVPGRV